MNTEPTTTQLRMAYEQLASRGQIRSTFDEAMANEALSRILSAVAKRRIRRLLKQMPKQDVRALAAGEKQK